MTPPITLSPEQQLAIEKILTWLDDPMCTEFRLGGFAGTGKTTIVKSLLTLLKEKTSIVCAFTGKAVNVLERKGVVAQTMHSLMYDVEIKQGKFEFHLKHTLVQDPDLIIVDEASMISCELYDDLKTFDKKLLFIGDPGQLEPVGDNPNLMRETDYVLTNIHRQAAQSPIIGLATKIREGGAIQWPPCEGLTIKRKQITSPEFLSVDQVIVARNTTRQQFNTKIRQFKKYPTAVIVPQDKLIVLRNNADFGVFNGAILFVDSVTDCDWFWRCIVQDELNRTLTLPIWKKPFSNELISELQVPRDVVYADFGYAITCHKSQGSEWDKVLVWDEPLGSWDMRKWRYTAITRASKQLIYCV